jgi:hypothetical protein
MRLIVRMLRIQQQTQLGMRRKTDAPNKAARLVGRRWREHLPPAPPIKMLLFHPKHPSNPPHPYHLFVIGARRIAAFGDPSNRYHQFATRSSASRSTGSPAAVQAPNPPARLTTFVNPFACSRLAAIAERVPP